LIATGLGISILTGTPRVQLSPQYSFVSGAKLYWLCSPV